MTHVVLPRFIHESSARLVELRREASGDEHGYRSPTDETWHDGGELVDGMEAEMRKELVDSCHIFFGIEA